MNPRDHPLFSKFFDLCKSAMKLVRETNLGGIPLSKCVSNIPGNTGSMIGTLFEYYLGTLLPSEFETQSCKMDCDFVNRSDRSLDFELKTSSQLNGVSGNRSSVQSTKKNSLLLLVHYDPTSLSILSVRFGSISNEDWIPQRGVGQQSRLGKNTIDSFLQCRTKEIPICFRQK